MEQSFNYNCVYLKFYVNMAATKNAHWRRNVVYIHIWQKNSHHNLWGGGHVTGGD